MLNVDSPGQTDLVILNSVETNTEVVISIVYKMYFCKKFYEASGFSIYVRISKCHPLAVVICCERMVCSFHPWMKAAISHTALSSNEIYVQMFCKTFFEDLVCRFYNDNDLKILTSRLGEYSKSSCFL